MPSLHRNIYRTKGKDRDLKCAEEEKKKETPISAAETELGLRKKIDYP